MRTDQPVTVNIVRTVRPGREEAFEAQVQERTS
jgi:antibiotic biosynthesis monooxygenase (ABM) superfamily enzyme